MSEFGYFKGSHNPLNVFRSIHYDSKFYQANPDYFHPWGIWVFCGAQSQGKTLSATKTVLKLHQDYPSALICSNLEIHGLDVIPFTDYSQLCSLSNGVKGIIFFIDEIQVLWNSLESKNIPVSEMAAFAQMRKDRRVIIGTSQVYSRIAKPIREQLRYVVKCRNYFKYLQVNQIIDPASEGYSGEKDGHLEGELVSTQWFFHRPEDYNAYDTLTKIKRIQRKV